MKTQIAIQPPTLANLAKLAKYAGKDSTPDLSPQDRALALAFLDHIGEADAGMRAEYLANLATHPKLIPGMYKLVVQAGIARWDPSP